MDFELLEERANDGEVSAIRQLVECYENGIGVEQNLELAEQWKKMLHDVDGNSGENSFSDHESRVNAHHEEIEKESERKNNEQSTPNREHSWKEIRHELEKMSFITLDQIVEKGNYLAELIVGERYLKSSIYEEQKRGAENVREAMVHIKNGEAGMASMSAIKDSLSEGWTVLAQYYLKNYNIHPELGEKAFEASSNAFEIDHSNIEEIIACYRYGIGCVKSVFSLISIRWVTKNFVNSRRAVRNYAD